MNRSPSDCLTEKHLALFGAIIHWFARYEVLMQEVMATVAEGNAASIMILTRNLDFGEKRKVLLDLLRHREVPLDQFDRVGEFLMVPHSAESLRYDIAHSEWMPAGSSSWIQPDWIVNRPKTVKPMRDSVNGESGHYIERERDKSSYSLADLEHAADTLAGNYAALSTYLLGVGLIRGREETVQRAV